MFSIRHIILIIFKNIYLIQIKPLFQSIYRYEYIFSQIFQKNKGKSYN